MPGLHKGEAFSKVFKLRTQEVVDIKLLEFQEGFFDVEWAVISAQKKYLIERDCSFKIEVPPKLMAEQLAGRR